VVNKNDTDVIFVFLQFEKASPRTWWRATRNDDDRERHIRVRIKHFNASRKHAKPIARHNADYNWG
jgi:hypothetical protein